MTQEVAWARQPYGNFKKTGEQINWQGPYLGTEIPGEYPVQQGTQQFTTKMKFSVLQTGGPSSALEPLVIVR